jgi:RNA polymerase sigma-70 factor (ECF subfamily)
MATDAPEESAPIENIAATLVANHREFLAFVEKRVDNRATAEEILQDAFVRSIDKLDTVRDTAIGWFYRVLRNAIIDHHRRTAAAERRHDAYVREEQLAQSEDGELHRIEANETG